VKQAVSPVAVPQANHPQVALRHRRDARRLTTQQLADLRKAFAGAQQIKDDRGYQFWAGIHGLPLPIYCTHNSPLFLAWHRAYLYFFEKALQDVVPGVTLPWWDWTRNHQEGIPPAYASAKVGGKRNPLYDSPIQAAGRRDPKEARTRRQPPGSGGMLPSPAQNAAILANPEFITFQDQLESIHGAVHMWVAGTMSDISVAAYDPIFWAHHCMIDRLWYLWQLKHPGARMPTSLIDTALPPFAMTVRQTLEVTQLGYDYAAATAAAPGPGIHG
jgi:tyrosinase